MLFKREDNQNYGGSSLERIELTPQIQRLMKKVLRAAGRCQTPTTANIASLAEIGEELCCDVLRVAQHLGLVEYEPSRL